MKTTFIFSLILLTFSACYFNPIVNSILDPVKETSNASLGLLALGGGSSKEASIQVEAQIKDSNAVNVSKPVLNVSFSGTSSARGLISQSVTGNNSGKFLVQLSAGTFSFKVFNSSGNSLGSFVFKISSDNLVSVTVATDSNFTVTNVKTYDLTQTVTLSEDAVVASAPAPSISTFSPTFGCSQTIFIYGSNFSTNSAEITVTGSACTFGSIISSSLTQIEIPITSVSANCTITVSINGQSTDSSTQYSNGC